MYLKLNRNMKKYIILIISVIVLKFNYSYAFEHLGSYITKPELCHEFDKTYTEDIKKIIKLLICHMTITDDEIIYKGESSDPQKMNYTIDGRYILGEQRIGDLIKYCPFFIDDDNNIHGMGMIFFKIAEDIQ